MINQFFNCLKRRVNKFLSIKQVFQDNKKGKKISMKSSSQNQQSSTKAQSISRSSSLIFKKELPLTMEEVISMVKKELRQCKIERQEERQAHKQEVTKLNKLIESLKHKMIQIKEKEYLKTVLSEDAEQERQKQNSLANMHKKLKLYAQKLQSDIKIRDEIIEKMKEEKLDINNQRQILIKEKEKHLELSIIEKINLQERIQVLQMEIKAKDNLLYALKIQGEQTALKEIQLKKLERKLVKKVNQVQHYEQQLKNFKQFQTQKLHTRIQTLQKQNSFLKQHISKIEQQFNSTNQCLCSSNQCQKQIDMFKNKYINKSRELSKVKVELSKEMFKEQFLNDVKTKQNFLIQSATKSRPRHQSFIDKDFQPAKTLDHGVVINKRQNQSKQKYSQYFQIKSQQNDEILIKNLGQNNQGSSINEKTLPNQSFTKYKSQLLKRKDSRSVNLR